MNDGTEPGARAARVARVGLIISAMGATLVTIALTVAVRVHLSPVYTSTSPPTPSPGALEGAGDILAPLPAISRMVSPVLLPISAMETPTDATGAAHAGARPTVTLFSPTLSPTATALPTVTKTPTPTTIPTATVSATVTPTPTIMPTTTSTTRPPVTSTALPTVTHIHTLPTATLTPPPTATPTSRPTITRPPPTATQAPTRMLSLVTASPTVLTPTATHTRRVPTRVTDRSSSADTLLLPTHTAIPTVTSTAAPPRPPDRIRIPASDLDAPVVGVGWETVEIDGVAYGRWQTPDQFAAGWHNTSAGVGQTGNLVLNGHHNVYGAVFGRLIEVTPGDDIVLTAGEDTHTYVVVRTMVLPEHDQPIEVRLENARWILPTTGERVTLVTCWPTDDNSHRLIIVARPADVIHP